MSVTNGATLPSILVLVGIVVMGAEAIIPGATLFITGLGILIAGVIGMVSPVQIPILGYAALILVSCGTTYVLTKRYTDLHAGSKDESTDATSLKGKQGTVTQTVTHDTGTVKLRDSDLPGTEFSARLSDNALNQTEIPEGEEVEVVSANGGSVLSVRPTEE